MKRAAAPEHSAAPAAPSTSPQSAPEASLSSVVEASVDSDATVEAGSMGNGGTNQVTIFLCVVTLSNACLLALFKASFPDTRH